MLKRYIRISLVIFVVSLFSIGVCFANGNEPEIQDYQVEQEWSEDGGREVRTMLPGSFRPAWFYYNYGFGYLTLRGVDALNERVHPDFPDLSKGMLVRRWNYVFSVQDDWRGGWVKIHGSQTSSTGTGDDFRQISYNLEMAGVLIEKSVYTDSLIDLSLGASGGRGTHRVNLLYKQPDTGQGENPWNEPVSSNLSQPFYFLQPQFNARFRLTGPFVANLQGGYTITVGRDRWSIEGEEIRDERLKADGFHFSAAVGVRF